MNDTLGTIDLRACSERYLKELTEQVIPFWAQHCPDRQYGGYFTHLDRDGSVYDTEKFMWMQWRIVYMFATLYSQLETKPAWLEIARDGYEFLVQHGKDEDGYYYFSIDRAGIPSTAAYEIYANCFATMGCAALYQASGENKYRVEAESAMQAYLRRMDNPKRRWEKGLAGRPKRQSLGNYMMLANLGQVMNECLETEDYATYIDDAVETVTTRFWNREYGLLFENINPDNTFDLDSQAGRHLTPGHGLEACWFILEHAGNVGNTAVIERICPMIQSILKFAWDEKYGGLFYFMDVLGRPHMELHADMKLWWVHNEAILATLYAYHLSGDTVFLEWFQRLDTWTWEHFPDPEHGEWFGYLNRRGEPTHLLKGGKWKTFFHLPRYLHIGAQLLVSLSGKSATVEKKQL